MIYIENKIKVTGFEGEYQWLVYEENNSPDVSFDPVSGTGTLDSSTDFDIITVKTVFANEAAMASTTRWFKVTRNDGCVKKIQLTGPTDCPISIDIKKPGPYSFGVLVTNGVPPYTYEWVYDEVLYTRIPSTDNSVLSLQPNGPNVQDIITVGIYVTDASGCTKYYEEDFTVCKPLASDGYMKLSCYPEPVDGVYSAYKNYILKRLVQQCPDTSIEWEEMQLATSDNNLVITNNNDGTITVQNKQNSARTAIIYYTVKDSFGTYSNQGEITVSIPYCVVSPSDDTTITGTNDSTQITAQHNVGDVITIPVESRIYSNSPVDWSSFTITTAPVYGTAVLNANREIEYTISDLTTNAGSPDYIVWQVSNEAGGTVTITDTILRNPEPKPTLTDDTICATCNDSVFDFDPIANDTGNIDRNSLVIVSVDPDLTITKKSNGIIDIIIGPEALSFNFIKYNVNNVQGVPSDTDGTISVIATCAGQPLEDKYDVTCLSNKVFNLWDRIQNANGLTYVWTEVTSSGTTYTSQGGTITGGYLGTVDFTSILPGEYQFQLSATGAPPCDTTTDTSVVTILVQDTPSLTITAKTDLGNGTAQIDYTYASIDQDTFAVVVDGTDPQWILRPTFNNGQGTMVYQSAPGTTSNFTITVVDICGNTIVVNDNITLA